MTCRRKPVTLAVVASCLATAVAVAAAPAPIRGRVLVDGKPAAGTRVALVPFEDALALARREARREGPASPLVAATTASDGRFALVATGVAGSVVRLSFEGGGAPPWRLARLVDVAGEDVGDVRLPKAAALAGRVLDEAGGPVVGATVTLRAGFGRRFQDATPGDGVPQTATTGADGTFRFAAASDGGNGLRVEAPALATQERVSVAGGALTRPVVMTLGQVVRGSVTLADRRLPAAGALVRFEGRTQTTRWAEARPDGTFVLEGVPRESGSFVADAGERGRGSAARAAGTETVSIALAPTAALEGRVVDAADGRPVANVRLVARGERGEFLARSGPDGRYSLRGLPPGLVRLTAEDERFVAWARGVRLSAGQPETRDVPLARAATVTGRVTAEDGRPIENAVVRVSPAGEGLFQQFQRRMESEGAARTGRDGSFHMTRLAAGDNQRLDVSHDEYEARAVGGLSLTAGATRSGVSVVLRRGRVLRGVVKDDQGRPLAGAEVTLQQPLVMRAGRGGMQVSMVGPGLQVRRETGADGRFEFTGLKPGDYALTARRSGFSRARLDPAKVGEAGDDTPVELVLRPGAMISGTVRDKTGAGASGWYLSARPASEGGGPRFGMMDGPGSEEPTGPDGAFVIDGLVIGETYELQAMGSSGLGPRKAGVVAPADGVEVVVTGAGHVRGRVVDAESGRPITDYQVRYQPDAQGGMRFMMRMGPGRGRGPYEKVPVQADDGTFVLEDVPAGRWTLEAFAPGYQAGSAAGIVVGEGETVEGVEVRLSRGAVLTGRVLDARGGRPILDASVRAEQAGDTMRRGMVRAGDEPGENEAMTDGEGRYEIAGLSPGTWTVTASHAEWSEKAETVEIKGTAAAADIRLGRGGSIGVVVSAAGRPVPGAQVSASPAGDSGFRIGPGLMGGGLSGITDESGRFRFERLTPGRYTLSASLRDQSSAPVEATLTGDESQEVPLTLAEGALVRGVVRGLPDAQLAGVSVSAQGPSDFFATTRTGAGGAFEIAGVPDGPVTLNARSGDGIGGGGRSASTTLTIAPGQAEAAAEIVFEAGFRVDGRVTRGGKPVGEGWVSAFPTGGRAQRNASDMTDESGAFVLEGLDEGRYTITASGQSGAPIQKTVDLAGDTTVDLEAPPARLAGTVVEADSGRPLGDVEVRLEEEPGAAVRFMMSATTDSSGRFALEDLEAKRYRVSFQKAAYQVETREIAAGDDAPDVRVELRRGEGIAVEARDGILATPLRGLVVRVVDGSGQSAFAGSVSLDSDGRGEIPSVRPGVYEVRAESSGYAPVVLPGVAVPSRTVPLVLTPGGSLEIRVGEETLALPEPAARLLTADGRVHAWNIFTTDGKIRLASASRRLENVAPGRYVLQVEGGARRDVAITEGGHSVVALP